MGERLRIRFEAARSELPTLFQGGEHLVVIELLLEALRRAREI